MLVMEYCSKGTLQQLLPMIESNWAMKLCIARDIMKAISFLHEKDMIHGNILSSNIFITEDMIAKIVDFSDIHSQQCSSSLGSSSDIFSFGLILLELITTANLNSQCHPSTIVNPYSIFFGEKGDVLVNVDLEDQLNLLYVQLKSVPILSSCPSALRTLAFQCCNPCAISRPTAVKCIEELDIMLVDIGLHTNEWHFPHFKSVVPKLPDVSSIPPLFYLTTSNTNSHDDSVSSSESTRSVPPSPPPYSFEDESGGTLLSTMLADDSTAVNNDDDVPVVVLVLDTDDTGEDMSDSHACSTNGIDMKSHLPVIIDYILDNASDIIKKVPSNDLEPIEDILLSEPIEIVPVVNYSETIENVPCTVLEKIEILSLNNSETIESAPVNVSETTEKILSFKHRESIVDIPSLNILANSVKEVTSVVCIDEVPVSYELIVPSKSTSRKKQIQENKQVFLENKIAELESKLEQMTVMVASTSSPTLTTTHPNISLSVAAATESYPDDSGIMTGVTMTTNIDVGSCIPPVSINMSDNSTITDTAIIPLEFTKDAEKVNTSLNNISLKEMASNINKKGTPQHSLYRPSFEIQSVQAKIPNSEVPMSSSPMVLASTKDLMSIHKPTLTPAKIKPLNDINCSELDRTILCSSPPSRRFPADSITTPNQQMQTAYTPIVMSETTATKYKSTSTVGLESPVPSLSYKKEKANINNDRKSLPFKSTLQVEPILTKELPKENQNTKFVAIDEKLDYVQAQMEKVLSLLEKKSESEPQIEEFIDNSFSVCSRSDIDINAIEYPYNETNMLLESRINARNYATMLKQVPTNNSISLDKPKLSPVQNQTTDLFMSKLLHSQYNHHESNSDHHPHHETKSTDDVLYNRSKEQIEHNKDSDIVLKSSRSFLNSLNSLKEDLDSKSKHALVIENDKKYLSTPKLDKETPYRSQTYKSVDDDIYLNDKFENNKSNNNKSTSFKKENTLNSFTQLIEKCKQMSAVVDEVVGSLDDNMNNFEERKRMYQAIQQAQSFTDSSTSKSLSRNYSHIDHQQQHQHVVLSNTPTSPKKSKSHLTNIDRSPIFLSPTRRPPIPHDVFTSNVEDVTTNNTMRSSYCSNEINEMNSNLKQRRRGRSRERSNSFSSTNNNHIDRSRSNERSIGSRSKSPTALIRKAIPKEVLSPHKSPITYSFGMNRSDRVISDRMEDRYISSNYGIMKQNFSSNLNHSDKYSSDDKIESKSRSKSPTALIRKAIPKEVLSPHKSPITYSFGMNRSDRVISDRMEDRYISSNYGIMKQNFSSNDHH